jgi:hypothetical protein
MDYIQWRETHVKPPNKRRIQDKKLWSISHSVMSTTCLSLFLFGRLHSSGCQWIDFGLLSACWHHDWVFPSFLDMWSDHLWPRIIRLRVSKVGVKNDGGTGESSELCQLLLSSRTSNSWNCAHVMIFDTMKHDWSLYTFLLEWAGNWIHREVQRSWDSTCVSVCACTVFIKGGSNSRAFITCKPKSVQMP